MAKKPELKISALIASVATLIVIVSSSWTVFTKHEPEVSKIPAKQPQAVIVTEKPVIKPQALQHTEPQRIVEETVTPSPVTPTPVTPPEKQITSKQAPKVQSSSKQASQAQVSFYVQVGAFKQKKLALQLQKKLKRKYGNVGLHLKSDLHLVWVGPVSQKQQATQLQQKILKGEKIEGFIVTKNR